jgi:hypothetical protein
MKAKLLLTVLFSLFIVQWVWAQIPQTMSYQGVLADADGNPVADGTVSLTFKLYEVATGGTALWEETQNVEVSNGIFNAILGSVNKLNLPFDKQYWLGVTVGQDAEMTPRITLTASPYSLGAIATVTEPVKGQGFVIRDANGNVTHTLQVDGTVVHAGTGTFAGIQVTAQDTAMTIQSKSGPAIVAISGELSEGQQVGKTNSDTPNALRNGGTIVGTGRGTSSGVIGNSGTGSGVLGSSTSGNGVEGESDSFTGVLGRSNTGTGVSGVSGSQIGVDGSSDTGVGVRGLSQVTAVEGLSGPGTGVLGDSDTGVGVRGLSKSNIGVEGFSISGPGIKAVGKPAGKFIGDVETEGEVFAESFHVVTFKEDGTIGDTLTSFNSDGTAEFKNEVELIGDAKIIFPDGTTQTSAAAAGGQFDGVLQNQALILKNALGDTVFSVLPSGESQHKGTETFLGGILLDSKNENSFMLLDEGGIQMLDQDLNVLGAWIADQGFFSTKPVVVLDTLMVTDADGNIVTMFAPDGTSLHKGDETFEGDVILKGTDAKLIFPDGTTQISAATAGGQFNGVLEDKPLILKNASGDTVFSVDTDGTSLHKGDETFEGDVILKGTDGKGIKLLDTNGATLAGFGREDLDTGQRIAVFGKAENPGDLAAAFEGDVEVAGEVYAESFHVVNANGDTLTSFNSDGTSFHKGKETYHAGIELVDPDGKAILIRADAERIEMLDSGGTQFAFLSNGFFQFRGDIVTFSEEGASAHLLAGDGSVIHRSVEAESFHVVVGEDTIASFDSSGSVHQKLETYHGGIRGEFAESTDGAVTLSDETTNRTMNKLRSDAGLFEAQNPPVLDGITFRTDGSAVWGTIINTANPSHAISGFTAGTGAGVSGSASSGPGVRGFSSGPAAGVDGSSIDGHGVRGFSSGAASSGVDGSSSDGQGVQGSSSGAGSGVVAVSSGTGDALRANHFGASGNIAVFQSGFANKARIDKTGLGFFNGGTQTGGADVAEAFEVEGFVDSYGPGDVIAISTDSDRTVEKSSEPYSTLVIGVYATKPGVLLSERHIDDNHDDTIPVASVWSRLKLVARMARFAAAICWSLLGPRATQ